MSVPDYQKKLKDWDAKHAGWQKRVAEIRKTAQAASANVTKVRKKTQGLHQTTLNHDVKMVSLFETFRAACNAVIKLEDELRVRKRSMSKNEQKDFQKKIDAKAKLADAAGDRVNAEFRKMKASRDKLIAATNRIAGVT